MTWLFEDRLTIQYQVQEMLRAERIFEPEGIEEELESYNPLIPDGTNWKATLLHRIPRRAGAAPRSWRKLQGHRGPLLGAGDAATSGCSRSPTRTCERENDEKTSAVHFLRFELTAPMIAALQGGRGARRRASIMTTTAAIARRAGRAQRCSRFLKLSLRDLELTNRAAPDIL